MKNKMLFMIVLLLSINSFAKDLRCVFTEKPYYPFTMFFKVDTVTIQSKASESDSICDLLSRGDDDISVTCYDETSTHGTVDTQHIAIDSNNKGTVTVIEGGIAKHHPISCTPL